MPGGVHACMVEPGLRHADAPSRIKRSPPLSLLLFANIGHTSGLHVAQVMPQSPAAQSGLHVGDIVVSVAGEPVASTTSLQATMVEDAIGRRLEITVWRNGALVDVIAVPRELTDA